MEKCILKNKEYGTEEGPGLRKVISVSRWGRFLATTKLILKIPREQMKAQIFSWMVHYQFMST